MCLGSSGSRSRPSDRFREVSIHATHAQTGTTWASGGRPPRLLILSEGAKLITWRLRWHFFGECRRGSRHFWNCWVCVGYYPAPGTHLKWGHVPYSRVCGVLDKYWEGLISKPRGSLFTLGTSSEKILLAYPPLHFTPPLSLWYLNAYQWQRQQWTNILWVRVSFLPNGIVSLLDFQEDKDRTTSTTLSSKRQVETRIKWHSRSHFTPTSDKLQRSFAPSWLNRSGTNRRTL